MLAYHFRVVKDDGTPTGWVGFAMARNMEELMWQIDTHCDPYGVEIKVAHTFSYCEQQSYDDEEEYKVDDETLEVHQTEFFDSKGWKKPKWVTDPSFAL